MRWRHIEGTWNMLSLDFVPIWPYFGICTVHAVVTFLFSRWISLMMGLRLESNTVTMKLCKKLLDIDLALKKLRLLIDHFHFSTIKCTFDSTTLWNKKRQYYCPECKILWLKCYMPIVSREKKNCDYVYVGFVRIKLVSCACVLNLVVFAFEKVMLE